MSNFTLTVLPDALILIMFIISPSFSDHLSLVLSDHVSLRPWQRCLPVWAVWPVCCHCASAPHWVCRVHRSGLGLWRAKVRLSLSLSSLSLSLSLCLWFFKLLWLFHFQYRYWWIQNLPRFFTELAKPVHRYLKRIWIVMWKWVGPIVMFIIFIASIILQLIDPLNYSVFRNVSDWD